MSGRGRGNANVEPPLKRSFHTSRGRGRGAGAAGAGVPPPGVPNAPTRLPVQEFAEPQQPIVEQVEKNVQPPVPTNMGLSYRGRGRGGFDPNPSRAPRNVDPPYCAPLEIRPPADGHGYQEIQAQRDRDYQFDASESGGPAPPYMQQPAHQQYGQPPPQIQPMLLQVAPAYGSGIAGQQGYQHQQPAPAPANPNPFDSHRLAQMFEQVSTLFASMACEMGKMNQNNNGYKI